MGRGLSMFAYGPRRVWPGSEVYASKAQLRQAELSEAERSTPKQDAKQD
jgi:hypothetical protein